MKMLARNTSALVLLPWKNSGRVKHNNGEDFLIPVRKRGTIAILV
jgi:hypothetical protein